MKYFKTIIYILSIYICICCDFSFAQNLDSVKAVLKNAKHDTVRCQALFFLSENADDNEWPAFNDQLGELAQLNLKTEKQGTYLFNFYTACLAAYYNNKGYFIRENNNPDQALYYYFKSLRYYKIVDDKYGMAGCYGNIGSVYSGQGNLKLGLDFQLMALKLRMELKDSSGIALNLNNIGHSYSNMGNYTQSINCHLLSLKIKEALGEKRGISASYNHLAGIYADLKEFDKALEYYNKSLAIREELGLVKLVAESYNNIGSIYYDLGLNDKSTQYHKKALDLRLKLDDKYGVASSYHNLGSLSMREGKMDEALNYYEMSLAIRREIQDNDGVAFSLNSIGSVYLEKKEYKKALQFCEEAYEMSKKMSYVSIVMNTTKKLSTIYESLNQHSKSLEMYKTHILMRDSLTNENTRKAALKSQFQVEYDLKERDMKLKSDLELKLIRQKNEADQQRKNIVIICSIIGLVIVGIFSMFLFNSLRENKRANTIITQQKMEVEESRKEILDSINYARRIQYALLAGDKLLSTHLHDYFVFFQPKSVVSGDFYWACNTPEGFIYITADCTGHGVPGAFMSLLNISKLNQAINENKIYRPDLILNTVRTEIINALNPEGSSELSRDGMDAVLCKIDFKTLKLQYASANNTFYIIRNNNVIYCKPDKMPVGVGQDNSILFTFNEIQLQKGDVIYTFSDGFADQFGGPKGKKFKYKQLCELLLSVSNESMSVQKAKIEASFKNWQGMLEQVDDVCVIGIRV
ncbi:MAG: tetratricopeptide repeat protein [Bacteroidia bacterium]|nr:tetratricopeptide repeat protein [Bacteroidia bacterium]